MAEKIQRIPLDDLPAGKIQCYACGAVYDYSASPELWFPTLHVHEFTQQLVIMTHQFCCGAPHHTA